MDLRQNLWVRCRARWHDQPRAEAGLGLSTAGPRRAPGGSVEGPRLMGAPRSVCPAMDNPRTCVPRAVLGARGGTHRFC